MIFLVQGYARAWEALVEDMCMLRDWRINSLKPSMRTDGFQWATPPICGNRGMNWRLGLLDSRSHRNIPTSLLAQLCDVGWEQSIVDGSGYRPAVDL